MAGIYVHIPLCRQACYYCDFHFSTYFDLKPKLLEALKTELTLQKSYLDKEIIDTIYFGGGTPSLLEIQELEAIINDIYKNFNINNRPEITIEANPDDLSARKTQDLKQAGFNRLSIGAQSFDDKTLRYLQRKVRRSVARRPEV